MDLIRCNATNPSNCKWITLIYREEMTDCKRVFKDNKAFLRKLRNYLKKQKLPESKTDFKFFAVAEPQGENHGNAWHIHLLLIFSSKAPFIINRDISDLWGYGLTDTHKVYDADTLALYFRAYLSDGEYVDDNNSDDSAEISIDILSDYERELLEKSRDVSFNILSSITEEIAPIFYWCDSENDSLETIIDKIKEGLLIAFKY